MNNMQNPCPMPVMIPVPIYCMSPYQYGGAPQMYNMPYLCGNMGQMNNMNLNPYGNMGQMNNMFPFPFGFPKLLSKSCKTIVITIKNINVAIEYIRLFKNVLPYCFFP